MATCPGGFGIYLGTSQQRSFVPFKISYHPPTTVGQECHACAPLLIVNSRYASAFFFFFSLLDLSAFLFSLSYAHLSCMSDPSLETGCVGHASVALVPA
jgi:hypothetical protein